MKILVDNNEVPDRGLEYPQLMISKDRTIIVLMNKHKEGTVVASGSEIISVGYTSRNWDADWGFTLFTGKIELSNDE